MSSLKEKMYRFMQGRYGMDDQGQFAFQKNFYGSGF